MKVLEKVDIVEDYRPSAKITELLHQIEKIGKKDKCLVFSQFTTFLDIIEVALDNEGIGFCRIDGSLNAHKRQNIIDTFATHSGKRVMLLSLKAASLGINLTVANHVFLMDPWWNPAVEEQAINRVHRIGQAKPVFVYKFQVKGTVEEKIMKRQSGKEYLSKSIGLDKNQLREYKLQELKTLFEESTVSKKTST